MNKTILLFLFISFLLHSTAQNATLKGVLMDGEENAPLIGANVLLDNGNGAATNLEGEYSISTEPGNYKVTFKYVGYETKTKTLVLSAGETKIINLSLSLSSNQLNDVVISASKYEQKLGDVPVSIVIIKPALIENKATRDAEDIINQVPGVQINENQVSIRGGSGWSYGAGSRVLVMVDEMPMLAGDAGDIKWTAIPLENISQIEILKGASSVLYGSSALNGVINIRTQYPKDKPITKINISSGFYLPGYSTQKGIAVDGSDSTMIRDNQSWWDGNAQYYLQSNFTHLRKLGQYNELVLGGCFMKDLGYRVGSYENRYRFNIGLKHISKKHEGLSYGVNLNNNNNVGSLFFLWANADSVLYPSGGTDSTTTLSEYKTSRIIIDPYLVFLGDNGNKHNIRTRIFRTNNKNNTDQAAISNYYFAEYQYQKRWERRKISLTTGAMTSYTDVLSELYGDHTSNNVAAFIQGDKKWNKFSLTAGMRLEYYRIDTVFTKGKLILFEDTLPFQPVFRLGATYQPFEYTFIRASYGQGYRFPSIAEKYVSTSVGPLNIFPNPNVNPETGWSAELGIKQGFKINNFQGYLDIAGFLTRYEDMMEFIFGIYHPNGDPFIYIPGQGPPPTPNNLGAQSTNIQHANIPGFEISIVGKGNMGPIGLSILGGYTYINPTAIDPDSAYLSTFSDTSSSMLKYRNKHMAKMDFQLEYKKWAFGISTRYLSFMENIDKVLTLDYLLAGYGDYRNARRTGDIVFDARLAFNITKESKVSILMNNVLNREYSNRPSNVLPPRTLLWQYSFRF